MHDAGIVHADVKSDNFLVELHRRADQATMIDFGLARFAASPPDIELDDGQAIVSGTPGVSAQRARRHIALGSAGVPSIT